MSNSPPTIRTIAKMVGLSKATVANALRGQANVAVLTAQRIHDAAEKVGYRRNPMITTVMSAMRRSRTADFHGVIACVDTAEPERPAHGPFHRQLLLGARARADELGFKLEKYILGASQLSVTRLNSILRSRGIAGLVLLPSWRPPHWDEFEWRSFTAVSADYMIAPPQIHTVCCDHYRSMMALMEFLFERGYRRPGLFMEAGRDERILLRMSAAFRAYQESHPDIGPVPILTTATINASTFSPWFLSHRPDVVLSHHTEVLELMEGLGVNVPESHGFVCLNLSKSMRATAGLDQQPRLIGARAVELVVAQLQRNDRGIPDCASSLTFPAKIIDGPTLRRARPTAA